MLISCPNCHSVYDISNKKISANGKKFKCAECGNIWTVYPSDENAGHAENATMNPMAEVRTESLIQDTPTVDNTQQKISDDLDIMFSRLSQNTKILFASGNSVDTMTWWQKVRHYCINYISAYTVIAVLLPICIILGGLLLYLYRYDIAAHIPGMDSVYAQMNYDSLYKGKDLQFKDVNIRNLREQGHSMVEISGRLYNNGKQIVTLLPVKAMIINDDDVVTDEKTEILQERQLEPDFSALFRIVMPYPKDASGKIRLTLDNNNQKLKEKN
ncbi:MAG: zinc-ribbon domain-containing protein [Alphaproteobacteria bacterium]|nr:zinc-ribbon domain-containing protein [Alphaproteobacteria bacterium]